MTKTVMVQGTTSDAGKSTLVTALCRIFARRGQRVVPFKPQNMALNSAVTEDGGEIGRAQAVQAEAAGVPLHTDMNPVLLKPSTDIGAQVIIHGKAIAQMEAKDYHDYKTVAMDAVLSSYKRLTDQYEAVFVEGAGSPAEINLRDRDIANMGFAEAVDCPVIIIADIDKGGVFAHLVGTLELLSPSEQNRVVGFVINRFRGDIGLLEPGLDWLEERTGKPVLAVLPYLHGFHLEAEDAVTASVSADSAKQSLKVIVPVTPRISNHTDFDALRLHPQVDFQYIGPGEPIPPADLVVLAGSKSVCADRAFLKEQGWDEYLSKHLRYGGKLIGICGGYQMLGKQINDPDGIEGTVTSMDGFSLLDFATIMAREKQLLNRHGSIEIGGLKSPVTGYEIHLGVSSGPALDRPLMKLIDDQGKSYSEGACSEDQQIIGSYLHGLFDHPESLNLILGWAGLKEIEPFDYPEFRQGEINRLADSVEQAMDWDTWEKVFGGEI